MKEWCLESASGQVEEGIDLKILTLITKTKIFNLLSTKEWDAMGGRGQRNSKDSLPL